MQCMKCGRDLEAGQVFCAECQEVMAKYPVKPGTVVQLPHRSGENSAKKQQPRRRTIPLEDQIALLRQLVKKLVVALLVVILLFAGACYVAITQFLKNHNKQALGQNYSVSQTVAESTAPSTDSE